MRWLYNDVDGLPIICTVCKQRLDNPDYKHGIYYFPVDVTEEDYEMIAQMWQVDPLADFCICEECIQGHCGAVPGLTAASWLALQWEAYKHGSGGQKTVN